MRLSAWDRPLLVFGLIAFLATEVAKAEVNWRLLKAGAEWVFVSPDFPQASLAITMDGGEPHVLGWAISRQNPKLGLLRYHAGAAGTRHIYNITRVAVVRLADGKLLGCPVWRYGPVSDSPPLTQPIWTWNDGELTVEDTAFAQTTVYRL